MEVAHKADSLDHAVISTAAVQSYSVNLSADFITTITKTLYPNPTLAMVREILCNAWDAHKILGKTDVPLQITTDNGRFVIRDFGPGIPDDNMMEVYCSYGSSTKVKLANQTGGFGLGAKVPFAYTDFFTVRNFNNGMLTVWNMSRGSTLTDGLPDARRITQIPTTHTGLEVSVSYVDEAQDKPLLTELAESVIRWGGMRAIIDGRAIDYYDLNSTDHKYLITGDKPYCDKTGRIFVQCGNVVYPVPAHSDYADEYAQLLDLRGPYSNQYGYTSSSRHFMNIVLYAEPNTLSYTPSRDALHMCQVTVGNIKKLLKELCDHVSDPGSLGTLNEAIQDLVTQVMNTKNPTKIARLFGSDTIGSHSTKKKMQHVRAISNSDWAKQAYYNYGDFLVDWGLIDYQIMSVKLQQALLSTVRQFVREGVKKLPRSTEFVDIHELMELAAGSTSMSARRDESALLSMPARRKHLLRSGVDLTRVYIWQPDGIKTPDCPVQGYTALKRGRISVDTLCELAPRKIILIRAAYQLSKVGIYDIKAKTNIDNSLMLVIHPRNSAVPIEEVEKKLVGFGFTVFNFNTVLAEQLAKDRAQRALTNPPKTKVDTVGVRKPRPKGLPSLKNLLPEDGKFPVATAPSYKNFLYRTTEEREYITDKPKFFLRGFKTANTTIYNCLFLPKTDSALRTIIRLYGDEAVVCVNAAQEAKFREQKIPSGLSYICDDIYKRLSKDSAYLKSMAVSKLEEYDYGGMADKLRQVSELKPYLLQETPLSEEAEMLHEVRMYLRSLCEWFLANDPLVVQITSREAALSTKIENISTKDHVVKKCLSPLAVAKLEVLNYSALVRTIQASRVTPDVREFLVKTLITAITEKPKGPTP